MGKEVKKVDFSDVHPLVDKSYDMLYNNTMRKALGQELIQMFAPMEETKTIRRWLQPTNVKGDFKSIVDAPSEIQGLLCLLWKEKKMYRGKDKKSPISRRLIEDNDCTQFGLYLLH